MILKQTNFKYIGILVLFGILGFVIRLNWPIKPALVSQSPSNGQILGAQINARGVNEPQLASEYEISLPENLSGKIKAKSYMVFSLKSGQIFSEKNSYEKLPIASLTKLMTGYVAYKNLNFKETAEVYPRTFWQVSPKLNLTFKDRILVQDLFDSMIIGSANDSAFALAQFYENSTQKNFIEEMNKTAAELGMLDTSFSNPAGFDSMQNFSTVSDLKILITKVFSLPAFKNLARKTSIEFTSLSGNSYKIKATNKLLNKYQDILAIKTGYTKESLGSMATVIDSGLGEIALIVLHSPEREKDTLNLREAVLNSTLKTEIRNLDF